MKTFFAIALGATGLAYWVHTQDEQDDSAAPKGMVQMIEQTREDCSAAVKALDEISTLLREARETEDPAPILDQVDTKVSELRTRLEACEKNLDSCHEMLHGPEPVETPVEPEPPIEEPTTP
jgi:hypothetical protein